MRVIIGSRVVRQVRDQIRWAWMKACDTIIEIIGENVRDHEHARESV